MIVDPDFLDHWRTRMLVDSLGGDELAPLYVLRLWGHCQNRKQTQLKPMPNPGLKALCRYHGDADLLADSMVAAGFIERVDESNGGQGFAVPKFEEKNAQLFAAWENGAKGGRPRKNPTKTHGLPNGNPTVTHGEPDCNPAVTDKSREDKSREEVEVSTNVDTFVLSPSVALKANGTAKSEPTGIFFPVQHSQQWELPRRKLDEYSATYADRLDILAEFRKAKQWLIDNKDRRKTKRGMPAFLTRWLNSNYDKAKKTEDGSRVARADDGEGGKRVYNPETGEIVTVKE